MFNFSSPVILRLLTYSSLILNQISKTFPLESILLTCTLLFYALLNNPTSLSTGIYLLACTDSSNYVHSQRHLLSNCFHLFQNQCDNDSLLIDELILPLPLVIVNTILKYFYSFSFFFCSLLYFSHCLSLLHLLYIQFT